MTCDEQKDLTTPPSPAALPSRVTPERTRASGDPTAPFPQKHPGKPYSYVHWAIAGAGWAFAAGIALMASIELNKSYDSLAALQQKNFQAQDQTKDVQLKLTNLERQMTTVQDQHQLQLASREDQNKALQRRLDTLTHSDQFPITGKEQPLAQGKLFWDKPAKKWTLSVANVKPLTPGKIYELWIVTTGKTLPAGTAQPDAAGNLTFDATLPDIADPITAANVTLEPGPTAPPLPTGPIQFLATFPPP